MKRLISMFAANYPRQLTYMLQMTTYEPADFMRWWLRVKDFRAVNRRRDLDKTRSANLLLALSFGLAFLLLGAAILLIILGNNPDGLALFLIGVGIFALYPTILAVLLLLVVSVLKTLVIKPGQEKLIKASKTIFEQHPGTIIAVAGSYGKTTMKEVLKTVLGESGKTAATPGNKNVAISHARFADSLDGDEKFVIVEFGEGYKGDVERFSKTIDPDIGIITGLAPNHLDKYGSMDNLRTDLLSLASYLKHQNVYINDQPGLADGAQPGDILYGHSEALGWKVSAVSNNLTGLEFTVKKGQKTLRLRSCLVGEHLVATLALAAALADSLGLSKAQIEAGIAATKPFEHRLEPKKLHGAWLIDDTYNGNIEGMRVGLELLKNVKTTGKKIYVTPGLVDQARESKRVHTELGLLIADAQPDQVILMKNSTTEIIKNSLLEGNYSGDITVINDPLEYYQNLEHTLAAGDVVLMQNDWTDNYA